MAQYVKILKNHVTIKQVEVYSFKEAKKIAHDLTIYYDEQIIYATVNDKTRIENTITLKTKNHE